MKHFNFHTMAFAMLIAVLTACSSYEGEPQMPEAGSTTRSEIKEIRTYSISEVQMIATKTLNKKPAAMLRSKVTPVMAQGNSEELSLLSDTVAYVVNYAGNSGFVVVANDTRVEEPLAYSPTGNFSEENLSAKYFFLDKIEFYLASLDQEKDMSYNKYSALPRRLVVEPRIGVVLGPYDPFNRDILNEHPNGQVGLMNVAAGSIISHSFETLTWNNVLYNFESINYALAQGPGFNPIDNDIVGPNAFNPFPPITFIYSYYGSVSAYNKLFHDVGKATETVYELDGTTKTEPIKVYNLYRSLGLQVSEIIRDDNLNTMVSLLKEGKLIHQTGLFNETSGFDLPFLQNSIGWVIDGCNVLIYDNNVAEGQVHIVWGWEGIADGYYSLPIIIGNNTIGVTSVEYVGVGL